MEEKLTKNSALDTSQDSLKDSTLILREAQAEDAENLNTFFSSIPTQGSIDIKILRQIDFFSLYRRMNVEYSSCLLEEKTKTHTEILGTASFLHNTSKVGSQFYKTSFACDLRVSSNRKAILTWPKYFLPQLKKLTSEKNINNFITAINLENSQVTNAFIRTKNKKSNRPVYELIRKFNLVTLHGFYPFIFEPNYDVKVEYALEKSTQADLINYLKLKLLELDLVPLSLSSALENTLHDSLLYSLRQFVVAKNADGKIVGCCYPLSSTLLQDYLPQRYDQQSNNFRQFLKFTSLLNFGRKLTKPFSRTQKDETLNFQFLHFLFFDHPDVFARLCHYTFKKSTQNEFLVYSYEQDQFGYKPPIGTINSETQFGLYEIKAPEEVEHPTYESLKKLIKKNIWLDGFIF